MSTNAPTANTFPSPRSNRASGARCTRSWASIPNSLIGKDGPAERHAVKPKLAEIFRQRTRAEWCEVFEGSDACFAPVLSVAETAQHPHHVARGSLP